MPRFHDDDIRDRRDDHLALKRLALPLQRRRRLDPQDPEALDDQELARLEVLEEELNTP